MGALFMHIATFNDLSDQALLPLFFLISKYRHHSLLSPSIFCYTATFPNPPPPHPLPCLPPSAPRGIFPGLPGLRTSVTESHWNLPNEKSGTLCTRGPIILLVTLSFSPFFFHTISTVLQKTYVYALHSSTVLW